MIALLITIPVLAMGVWIDFTNRAPLFTVMVFIVFTIIYSVTRKKTILKMTFLSLFSVIFVILIGVATQALVKQQALTLKSIIENTGKDRRRLVVHEFCRKSYSTKGYCGLYTYHLIYSNSSNPEKIVIYKFFGKKETIYISNTP